ncbi:Calx-beta domain-containing protein [Candidatus Poriferisodalis sp.]|uniref:Calx-beta domain-containing protein n=1 Tax=Candidatus Poriferisodalis sp. TaxID=3101277 RepID=UPI003B02DA1B
MSGSGVAVRLGGRGVWAGLSAVVLAGSLVVLWGSAGSAQSGSVLVSVGDASVAEGGVGERLLAFTVSLSASPTHEVRVTASAVPGASGTASRDAGAGRDYVGFTGRRLVFAAGATGAGLSQTVAVRVLGDHVVEPDETFILRVNNLVTADSRVGFAGGHARKTEATGTIVNDDSADDTGVVVSVADVSVAEGDSGTVEMEFAVSLSASPSHEVRLKASALRGRTGAAAASRGPGRDFGRFLGKVLVFEAGAAGDALTQAVTVEVVGDTRAEPDETVLLRVNNLDTADQRVRFAGGIAARPRPPAPSATTTAQNNNKTPPPPAAHRQAAQRRRRRQAAQRRRRRRSRLWPPSRSSPSKSTAPQPP